MIKERTYFVGVGKEGDAFLSHVTPYDAESEAALVTFILEDKVEPYAGILSGSDPEFKGCTVYISQWSRGYEYEYGEMSSEDPPPDKLNAWTPEKVMFLLQAWKKRFERQLTRREAVPRDFLEEMVVRIREKFGYGHSTSAVDLQLQWAMDERAACEIPDTMGKTWAMNKVLAWHLKLVEPKKIKEAMGFLQTTDGYVNLERKGQRSKENA